MKIRRIILKWFRNFEEYDRSFEDTWMGSIPESLLLMGPNGSGKTTLLNSIAALWAKFQDFLNFQTGRGALDDLLVLRNLNTVAAIEIVGLDEIPVWIWMDHDSPRRDFVIFGAQHEQSHRIRIVYNGLPTTTSFSKEYWYAAPGDSFRQIRDVLEMPEWPQRFADRLQKNLLGAESDLPNVLLFQSENRFIAPIKQRFTVTPEPGEFRWLARYEPTTSRKGSLQNYLFNLKVVNEAAFAEIVEQVDSFLNGKHLGGFDRKSGNLIVKIDDGGEHPIEQFSSGEKQVLLMIATITRWLRPGGIVLIDEPDLHLHVSLMTALVAHLRHLVPSKGGQLILASHAPELWKEFTETHTVRLGNDKGVK